jgi:transposase
MTMPRPTKYTAKTRDAILQAIEQGATYEQAAAVAGITYETLRSWRAGKPVFSVALEKAEASGVVARLERIDAAGRGGAWQADAWWLERRYPEQWGRRDRVQVHHEGEVSVLLASPEGQRMMAALLQALEPYGEAKIAAGAALMAIDSAEGGAEEHDNGHRN